VKYSVEAPVGERLAYHDEEFITYHCHVCKEVTNYVDVDFDLPFCSDECLSTHLEILKG